MHTIFDVHMRCCFVFFRSFSSLVFYQESYNFTSSLPIHIYEALLSCETIASDHMELCIYFDLG